MSPTSRAVWKFPVLVWSGTAHDMPEGAEIIAAAMQGAVPTLWALVDPAAPRVARYFAVVGTGHEVAPLSVHRGTCFAGAFVWHIFETYPISTATLEGDALVKGVA